MSGVARAMGRRHRERRKVEKRLARVIPLGYALCKSELGELHRRHASKAEVRRRLIEAQRLSREHERSILDEICRRATADIQAAEDALVLEQLEEWLPMTLWQHLRD